MNTDFDKTVILGYLDDLIRLQQERLRTDRFKGLPRKRADDTRDWLAINFLFRIGREYHHLSPPAREQLDVIFHGWTSPEPISLDEFTSMLETLRELIVDGSCDFLPALDQCGTPVVSVRS